MAPGVARERQAEPVATNRPSGRIPLLSCVYQIQIGAGPPCARNSRKFLHHKEDGMNENLNSRRQFLAQSAKLAALAGLTASAGCASESLSFTRGPELATAAGPKPRAIGAGDPIRFGIIGIGGQGRHDVTRLLTLPGVEIKAIADPDPKNLKQAVELVKKATGKDVDTYTGFDDWKTKLLARTDIDAVFSATPCYMHGPIHLGCFAAGKHFYGEKPLCTEAREADALVEAQKKNPDIKAQIGFQRRGSKLYAEGIQKIRDGVIGDPMDGRAAWNNSWGPIGLPNETAETWPGRIWLGRAKYSGDWMLEQACHTWDVLCWAAGAMPVAAYGRGRNDVFKDMDPGRDVTDFYFATLEFPNGFTVDFQHSWICPKTDNASKFNGVFERIAGKKGGICLDEGVIYPREGKEPIKYRPQEGDHYTLALTAFLNSIRTGAPVVCGVEQARMATYTGLLVRQAVREGRRVQMKELL
jgi:myo-inositol 2-dehydrogenase / D-chiro-inositol 1-dehydrogenase